MPFQISRGIGVGLVLSVIGDACLVYPAGFELGVAAFALAHLHYIKAFGWRPLNIGIGILLYSLVGGYLAIAVIPGLPDRLLIMLPLYAFLLTTTAWRALARAAGSPVPSLHLTAKVPRHKKQVAHRRQKAIALSDSKF